MVLSNHWTIDSRVASSFGISSVWLVVVGGLVSTGGGFSTTFFETTDFLAVFLTLAEDLDEVVEVFLDVLRERAALALRVVVETGLVIF